MKKAKIMLASLAIIAVVGGSLAFKASKFTGQHIFTGSTSTSCPTELLNSTFTSAENGNLLYITTSSSGTGCFLDYATHSN